MITERPLSDKEIKSLKSELRQLDKRNSANVRFLIIWMIFAGIAGIIFYANFRSIGTKYFSAGIVLVYALIGIWVFTENHLKQKKQRNKVNYIFSRNKVKSIIVEPLSYIQLAENDDEGVYYLFQLADNKILSMGGQDFYPTKQFPCSWFEIVLSYDKKGKIVMLQKYASGKRIHPAREISGKQKNEWMGYPGYPDPELFTIIDGNINNIDDIIRRK